MGMYIKNPETYQLAQELADLRDVSLTQAVTDAIRKALDRERQLKKTPLSLELLEIGKRCAAHLQKRTHLRDRATQLYGRTGLPE